MNRPRHNRQQTAPLAPRADATAARQSEGEGFGRPSGHPHRPGGSDGVLRLTAVDDLAGYLAEHNGRGDRPGKVRK
jgi:hypothetical protein